MDYKRQSIKLKYPELVHGTPINPGDFYIANEGEQNEIFEWYTDKYPKPTNAEMLQWYNNLKYKQDREYEPLTEQLDKLYHDIDAGIFGEPAKESSWYLSCKALKDETPKPEA